MLYRLRLALFRWLLHRRLKGKQLPREFVSLNRPRHITVLTIAQSSADEALWRQWAEKYQLKGHQVTIVPFFPMSKAPDALQLGPHLTKSSYNWIFLPKEQMLRNIATQRMDILLCWYTRHHPLFELVCEISPAKMRMGPVWNGDVPWLDYSIRFSKSDAELPEVLDTFDRYLKMLRSHATA